VMTRESYLEYSRIGMGRALARAQREAVWSLHEKLVEQALAEGKGVPSLAWWLLLGHLTQAGQSGARWARVFVDECQDLTGTKLAILRRQAEHLVLAGDSEQMIYRGTSPFLDAGMDMRRVTTVSLSQVYRNTIPIFEFARRVREMIPDAEEGGTGHATRMGPVPDVHFESGWNGLLDHLVERIRMLAFRDDALYEPGSIAVLTLGRPEDYAARLEARNIKVRIAKHDDVDFAKTDAVFVSTIHTAKGMDFPVVFVLLDEIEEQRRHYLDDGADPAACAPRLMRLLYVASTRGMDILEIFCQQSGGREVPEVRALKAAHQEMLALFEGDGETRHPE
ncbi:MAG TPA: 3'-5' exonuclease, partial [Spirochaetota bacterium]|nr:3'-5' exonuclease [Spirochaetota bacterium]